MTIYEIKRQHERAFPDSYFFSRGSMRFFGQTLRDFHVKKQPDGNYRIWAVMRDRFTGKERGITDWIFITDTKKLKINQNNG